MYELWHIGAAYVVGTAVGIVIFRQAIKEHLIVQALDTLVEQDYVRSYVDDEGITQLKKWYDLDDLLEDAKVRIKVDGEEIEDDAS